MQCKCWGKNLGKEKISQKGDTTKKKERGKNEIKRSAISGNQNSKCLL